jgi:hypothetical protein
MRDVALRQWENHAKPGANFAVRRVGEGRLRAFLAATSAARQKRPDRLLK